MKFTAKTASLLPAIFLVFTACLEELDNLDKLEKTTLKPTVEFPLVNSDFTMKDFLTEGKSKAKITEQNGVMVLNYRDSIETPSGDKFFTLPNQQSPTISFTGPEVSFPSPGATITINKTLTFPFNPSQSESIDSILVKSGQMAFQMSSTFPANISLTISIPSLKIPKNAYQQTFSFTGPGSQNPTVDLQGSKLDLTGNTNTTNTLTLSIKATITDTGQPINSTHRFDCKFDLNSLQFKAMFGSLGTRNFSLKADSINVDVFENALNGSIEFLSPSVKLSMQNSFGVPINFNIKNLIGLKDNAAVLLSGAALSAPLNPYPLSAPSVSERGQSHTTVLTLNSTNSNLPKLISVLPKYLSYQFDLTLNPNGPVKNFVQDDSKVKVLVDLDLPFHLKASALALTREYDFDGLGIDEVGETKIVVKTTNEAPLDAFVQVYFASSTGAILDSLFTNRSILKSPPVDANGFTQTSASLTQEVALTNAKIDRINQATKLMITAVMFTSSNGTVPVKLTSADKLKVSIGLSSKIEFTIN